MDSVVEAIALTLGIIATGIAVIFLIGLLFQSTAPIWVAALATVLGGLGYGVFVMAVVGIVLRRGEP